MKTLAVPGCCKKPDGADVGQMARKMKTLAVPGCCCTDPGSEVAIPRWHFPQEPDFVS